MRSSFWATRIHHESTLHEENSFLTLTYAPEHLPENYSVDPRHTTLFMKRLRKHLEPKRIRFFLCGEYGDDGQRPHYHVMLFGHDFKDKYPWKKYSSGHIGYRSSTLETLWTLGHAEIGTVTLQSAGYVARYCIKKVTGDRAKSHYRRVHPTTGLIWDVLPEYIRMSNKPGLGSDWYDQFSTDCFPSDFVTVNGDLRSIPPYYVKKLEKENPKLYAEIKASRMQEGTRHFDNNTPARLEVREEVQRLKAVKLTRDLEKPE